MQNFTFILKLEDLFRIRNFFFNIKNAMYILERYVYFFILHQIRKSAMFSFLWNAMKVIFLMQYKEKFLNLKKKVPIIIRKPKTRESINGSLLGFSA